MFDRSDQEAGHSHGLGDVACASDRTTVGEPCKKVGNLPRVIDSESHGGGRQTRDTLAVDPNVAFEPPVRARRLPYRPGHAEAGVETGLFCRSPHPA